jgi:putative ABC transport system permease protein
MRLDAGRIVDGRCMTVLEARARNLMRDLKSGEIAVLLLALLVAVASLTAVGFFHEPRSAARSRKQAGEVLAADLRLESGRAIADTYAARRGNAGSRPRGSSRCRASSSTATSRRSSHCARSARAIRCAGGSRSPTCRSAGAPDRRDAAPGEAWADSRLLARLAATCRRELGVGSLTVRVTHVLDYRPDQGAGFADLSATLMIRSRGQYRRPGSCSRAAGSGTRAVSRRPARGRGDFASISSVTSCASSAAGHRRREPQIRASSDRAGRFLSLASLVSVLLSASPSRWPRGATRAATSTARR